jgi:23S rRNA (cytosine1962-C5)-methyltransferase
VIKLTDFGHLGIFPEQHKNWKKLGETIARFKAQNAPDAAFKVLNLFAYTGGSTLAAARAGAQVAHIDASKTSVAWARENAAANQGESLPVRWLVEDAVKFVDREIRRGQIYQGLILDPPSYGRGPDGEVWKIEDHMVPLIRKLAQLTDKTLSFVLLSSHSHGYTPLALANLINSEFKVPISSIGSEEMTLNERDSERVLPSGASALYLSQRL